mgnify:FL=1
MYELLSGLLLSGSGRTRKGIQPRGRLGGRNGLDLGTVLQRRHALYDDPVAGTKPRCHDIVLTVESG